MQMDGNVSKNVEAPHRSGRNESWLKIKCVQRAKFPIVGFVKDPAGVVVSLNLVCAKVQPALD